MKPATLLFCFLLAASAIHAAEPLPRGSDWQVAGRLGLLQFVVVSESKAKDRDFYDAIIKTLCDPGGTCFLRFFTNLKKGAREDAVAGCHSRRAHRHVPALGEAG